MCVFCSIASHEIPADIVYEDELCLAFKDIAPATKDHTLVIPKQHVDHILEATPDLQAHLFQVACQLAKEYDAQGVNLLTNIKERAGQTVMHAHIHILPRWEQEDKVKIELA